MGFSPFSPQEEAVGLGPSQLWVTMPGVEGILSHPLLPTSVWFSSHLPDVQELLS